MHCYACDREPAGLCTKCGRQFCSVHGDKQCDHCRDIPGAYPSTLVYRSVLGVFVIVLGLAGLQLATWPSFAGEGSAAADRPVTRATSVASPVAAATSEPTATPPPTAVPATPTPAATPTPEPRRYTVQGDDTLSDIAQRFGITTARLMAANPNVDPSLMRIGSVLIIP